MAHLLVLLSGAALPAFGVGGDGGGFADLGGELLHVVAETVEAGGGEVLAAGGPEPAFLGAIDLAPGAGDAFAEGG
jgi:hypothetical protein